MRLEPDDDPARADAVWDLFRRDEPDARAIQAAYVRFLARRPASLSAFTLLRWLAAGFALGWGVAFAATGDPLFGAGLRRNMQQAQPVVASSAVVHGPRPRPREPVASALPPSESAAPAPETLRAAPPSPPAPRVASSAPPSADPKWQRAADALRARDYAAAESALRELELAGAPSDRDAASLALAQVLLTRGRLVEARARLERLSVRAGSPVVREKALSLLTDASSPTERSSGATPVPK